MRIHKVDKSLFKRQPIVKPRPSGPSPLAVLLAEQTKRTSNPFFKYSKYNGEVRDIILILYMYILHVSVRTMVLLLLISICCI